MAVASSGAWSVNGAMIGGWEGMPQRWWYVVPAMRRRASDQVGYCGVRVRGVTRRKGSSILSGSGAMKA
jgi:hypothetical protein